MRKPKLNPDQLLGIIRHSLSIIGGVLIAFGYASEGIVETIIGSVIALTSAIWSIRSK
jgi:hypothetical protein